MCKSSVELSLFIKRSSTKHLRNSIAAPGKTNYIHCSRNGGLFWEAEQGYLSLTTKTHLPLETFFPSEVPCSAADWSVLIGCSRSGRCVQGVSSGRNAHIRSSTVVYVIKNNDLKNSPKLVRIRKWDLWHRNTLLYVQNIFFETLSMLSMRIKLFTSVNNSECMKQHCTAPLTLLFFSLYQWRCFETICIIYTAL